MTRTGQNDRVKGILFGSGFCDRSILDPDQDLASLGSRSPIPAPKRQHHQQPHQATHNTSSKNQKALNQGARHPNRPRQEQFWSMVKVSFDHCEETQALSMNCLHIFQSQVSLQFLTHSDSQPLIHLETHLPKQ